MQSNGKYLLAKLIIHVPITWQPADLPLWLSPLALRRSLSTVLPLLNIFVDMMVLQYFTYVKDNFEIFGIFFYL